MLEIGHYDYDKDITKREQLLALGGRLPEPDEVWILFFTKDGTLATNPLEIVPIKNYRMLCDVINEDTLSVVRTRFAADENLDSVELIAPNAKQSGRLLRHTEPPALR